MSTRQLRALLCIALLLTSTACGSSGSGSDDTLFVPWGAVIFLFGQAYVETEEARVDFGDAGAPGDGSIQKFNTIYNAYEVLERPEDPLAFLNALPPDAAVGLLFAIDPVFATLLAVLALDERAFLDSDGPEHAFFKLGLPVGEDANAEAVALPNPNARVDMGAQYAWLEADLPRGGVFGRVEAGVTIEVERTSLGGGMARYDVAVDSTDDSPVSANDIQVLLDETPIASLGSLTAGVPSSLSGFANGQDWAVRLSVRFVTNSDPFFEDIGVDFDFGPPDDFEFVDSVGSSVAPERVQAIPSSMWNPTNPSDPLQSGEIGVAFGGAAAAYSGRFGASGYTNTDTRSHPGTTYGTQTIGLPAGASYKPNGGADTQQVAPTVAGLFAFGAWGLSIANFDNNTQSFGADVVVDTANITDLSPFDGNIQSGAGVYVDNTNDELKFITRDGMEQYIVDSAATLTNSVWPGASGKVVSAFRHASGDLLFLTDGTPGEVWVLPSGASTATRLGSAGDNPRNIRAAGNIALIGAYGTGVGFGSVRIYVRGAGGTWTPGFGKTGPRSVGVDAMELPDGRVALCYPAFLSHTVGLTIVNGASGAVLSDETIALPAGCTNPGHCTFVREPGLQAILVSCNGSDALALLSVSLDP